MTTGFSVWLPVSLLADVRSSSHRGDNRMKTTGAPERHRRERHNTKMKEWSILTPINKAVVVLLVGFGAVPFSGKDDVGDSLRATGGIVMKGDILERSDGGVEQFL